MDSFDIVGEPHEIEEHDAVEHALVLAAKCFAICGGLTFCALVMMSLISIVGRKLGAGPITGDMEMMQTGTAASAALFIPYCTIMNDNLKVEFFTENVRPAIRRIMDACGSLLLALVFGILAWRTLLHAIDGIGGEVTALLSIPIWLPTAVMVPCFGLAALCALHRAWNNFMDLRRAA